MSRRFTIGRDRHCDVPIHDESVSRQHAEVWLADDGSVTMADRGSANGTTVVRGAQKFTLQQAVILPGDYIRMGAVMLSADEIVEAIETKYPGALTPLNRDVTGIGQVRPVPKAAPASPPPLPGAPPHASSPVRCSCGAMKAVGETCPACHR